MLVSKHKKAGAQYSTYRTFHAQSGRVFDVLGYDMRVQTSGISTDGLGQAGNGAVHVWFVEDEDEAAVVGINIILESNPTIRLIWQVSATSEEFADRVIEKLQGELYIFDDEEDEEVEEGDEDEEDDEEVVWGGGDIVEMIDGVLARVDGAYTGEGYRVVRTDGKEMVVQGSEITEDASSDSAYEEIVQAFGLEGMRLDGDPSGDYNIVRFRGSLVRVLDVDGDDFTINVDEEWMSIGESTGLHPGLFDFVGVHQMYEDVQVDIGDGWSIYGTVQGIDDNGNYVIRFDDDAVVPPGKVGSA